MRSRPSIIVAAFLLLLSSGHAFAYLDPITGSFLIQGLIGVIAAIMVGVKRVRQKLLELMGFRKPTNTEDQK